MMTIVKKYELQIIVTAEIKQFSAPNNSFEPNRCFSVINYKRSFIFLFALIYGLNWYLGRLFFEIS